MAYADATSNLVLDPQALSQPRTPHMVVVGTRVWWRERMGVSWRIITGRWGKDENRTPLLAVRIELFLKLGSVWTASVLVVWFLERVHLEAIRKLSRRFQSR